MFASNKTLFSSENLECHISRIELTKKVVGKTPLAHIDTINGTHVFAKLEYFNPFSYSVKDRTAAYMLTGPLERGEIKPSSDIIWIEASSGNLGIAYGKIGKHCRFLEKKKCLITKNCKNISLRKLMKTITKTTKGSIMVFYY